MAKRKEPEPRTVRLTTAARSELRKVLGSHDSTPRERVRAQILLQSDMGWDRETIAKATGSSVSTVGRVRRRYCEEGMAPALAERPRSGGPPKLTSKDEQVIVALACSKPPEGFSRWSVRLLTEEVHRRGMISQAVSRERIRVVLQDHDLKPWREKNVVRAAAG